MASYSYIKILRKILKSLGSYAIPTSKLSKLVAHMSNPMAECL